MVIAVDALKHILLNQCLAATARFGYAATARFGYAAQLGAAVLHPADLYCANAQDL